MRLTFGVDADAVRAFRGGCGGLSGRNRLILGVDSAQIRKCSGWNRRHLGVKPDARPPFINLDKEKQ
jgi:hypothetical protein